MTIDEFWDIVERVHASAPHDMAAKCLSLEKELLQLPVEEILAFERHFGECFARANQWDIWGAAYVIHGGCSDDGFTDFRSTLISLGRRPFEAALADADSLAKYDIDRSWACYEGYQYVASKVYRGHYKYEPPANRRESMCPHGPTGARFEEEEMTPRFPRLVAKYNYKDTDPEVLKERRCRQAKDEEISEWVTKIMLNAVIPKSGLVPPPRIVKQILATGKAPESSGLHYEWEPFELNEGNFWKALTRLKGVSLDDLKTRPDLKGKPITLDTSSSSINDYEHWIKSLKERGLQ